MEIKTTDLTKNSFQTTSVQSQKTSGENSDFAKELKNGETKDSEKIPEEKKLQTEDVNEKEEVEKNELPDLKEQVDTNETSDLKEEKTAETKADEKSNVQEKDNNQKNNKQEKEEIPVIKEAFIGLEDAFEQIKKINQKDEIENNLVDIEELNTDKKDIFKKELKKEDTVLIDNNMNIQEPHDKLNLQTNANTNFTGDGQPFAEMVQQEQNSGKVLKSTKKELEEEKAILSTMEENIAIANKNMLIKENAEIESETKVQAKTKTVTTDKEVKKVDTKTNIKVDTVVKFDTVIMDKNDVEFFSQVVNGEITNIHDVQAAEKSSRVSKTLADLLAKSMNENRPVRIDFDNNISVIIKISRDGKISADFLPSSQVAEAYLKENLPLLKQRFDDNNIEYEELNQRKQQNKDEQENRRKGNKDE